MSDRVTESQSISGWKESIKVIKFNSLIFVELSAEQIYLVHLFQVPKSWKKSLKPQNSIETKEYLMNKLIPHIHLILFHLSQQDKDQAIL